MPSVKVPIRFFHKSVKNKKMLGKAATSVRQMSVKTLNMADSPATAARKRTLCLRACGSASSLLINGFGRECFECS